MSILCLHRNHPLYFSIFINEKNQITRTSIISTKRPTTGSVRLLQDSYLCDFFLEQRYLSLDKKVIYSQKLIIQI